MNISHVSQNVNHAGKDVLMKLLLYMEMVNCWYICYFSTLD